MQVACPVDLLAAIADSSAAAFGNSPAAIADSSAAAFGNSPAAKRRTRAAGPHVGSKRRTRAGDPSPVAKRARCTASPICDLTPFPMDANVVPDDAAGPVDADDAAGPADAGAGAGDDVDDMCAALADAGARDYAPPDAVPPSEPPSGSDDEAADDDDDDDGAPLPPGGPIEPLPASDEANDKPPPSTHPLNPRLNALLSMPEFPTCLICDSGTRGVIKAMDVMMRANTHRPPISLFFNAHEMLLADNSRLAARAPMHMIAKHYMVHCPVPGLRRACIIRDLDKQYDHLSSRLYIQTDLFAPSDPNAEKEMDPVRRSEMHKIARLRFQFDNER
jgi:hypothetical protein